MPRYAPCQYSSGLDLRSLASLPLVNYQAAGGIDLSIRPDSIPARIAVGDALEFARVPSGLSISDLARAMRLSTRQYLHIVAGDRPLSFTEALLAADALRIAPGELARLVGQSLGAWDSALTPSFEDVRRIGRQRLFQLLVRLEREGNEDAGRARQWLERRYGALDAKPETRCRVDGKSAAAEKPGPTGRGSRPSYRHDGKVNK